MFHYRGAPPAVNDLLGGHADIMFSDAPFFLEHIKAGKLIPLAVGTPATRAVAAGCADHERNSVIPRCRLQHLQPVRAAQDAS